MKKKKRWFRKWDEKGYSLVEVLAAFMILVMASQILLLGIAFTKKISFRTEQMEMARREAGIHLYEKSSVVSGTVEIEFWDGGILEKPGLLYTGHGSDLDVSMKIIWTEEPDWMEESGE